MSKYRRFSEAPNQTTSPIWLVSCHIPIIFDHCQHKAVSDSQASDNLMTRSFAEQHNFAVKLKFHAFHMVDGTTQLSTGIVWIRCGVKHHSASVRYRLFYVFEKLSTPILIGRSFWNESQSPNSIPACHFHYTIPYPCIPLTFPQNGNSGKLVMSAVDTGTNSSLMSLKFARKEQLFIKAQPFRQIRIPNGQLVSIVGTVKTKIQLGSLEGIPLDCRFLVVSNLSYDVGLGRSFLFNVNNKPMVLSNLTYMIRSSDFVLYGLVDEMSPIGDLVTNWRIKSKAPGDIPEVEEEEKKREKLNRKRKQVERIWHEIEIVTTKEERDALEREFEQEMNAKLTNPEGERGKLGVLRSLLLNRRYRDNKIKLLEVKWKEAKRKEKELEKSANEIEVRKNEKLKRRNAGDWSQEGNIPAPPPNNRLAAHLKQLGDDEKQRQQENDYMKSHSRISILH